jgi:hypothetical protein
LKNWREKSFKIQATIFPSFPYTIMTANPVIFVYGACLSPKLLQKRDITVINSSPARLASSWALSFCHRGGYATLLDTASAKPSQLVHCYTSPHGVILTLKSQQDLEKLKAREVGYSLLPIVIDIAVNSMHHPSPSSSCLAFLSNPSLVLYQSVPPTQRYIDILISGARYHGLDEGYVEWLESVDRHNGGPLPSEYDACPAQSIAQILGVAALVGISWASVSVF